MEEDEGLGMKYKQIGIFEYKYLLFILHFVYKYISKKLIDFAFLL